MLNKAEEVILGANEPTPSNGSSLSSPKSVVLPLSSLILLHLSLEYHKYTHTPFHIQQSFVFPQPLPIMKLSANFAVLLASISVTIASPIYDTTIVNKESAPLLSSTSAAEHEISNNYIVVFKKNVGDEVALAHHSWVTGIHEASISSLRKRSQIPLMKHHGDSDEDFPLDVDSLTGLKHTYKIPGGFTGYSGSFDDSVLEEIRKHSAVSLHPCPPLPRAYLATGVSCAHPETRARNTAR